MANLGGEPFTTANPYVLKVGYCIYCTENNTTDLSREHVFPHGLGGGLILLGASCKKHRDITGAFEGVFLGKDIGPFRQRTGMPSKRPKHDTFPLVVDDGTHVQIKNVPADLHPGLLVLPVFKSVPGALEGGSAGPVVINSLRVFHQKEHAEKSIAGLALGKAKIRETFNLYPFVRLIAKIAHGITVSEYGRDFQPTLIDLIEGRGIGGAGYWIGNSAVEIPAGKNSTHGYQIARFYLEDLILLIVELRLFASGASSMPTPTYAIVAGFLEKGVHSSWVDREMMGQPDPPGEQSSSSPAGR